jgi:hypothetical protein
MASTYEPIATTTLSSAANSVTFSSIAGTYTDLIAILNVQVNVGGGPIVTFNNDTASNYSITRLYGDGSTIGSNRNSNQNNLDLGTGGQASITANQYSPYIFHFMNYANATTYKTSLLRLSSAGGGFGGLAEIDQCVGLWRNTNAITTITLTCSNSRSFQSGSSFTLYGIKAA